MFIITTRKCIACLILNCIQHFDIQLQETRPTYKPLLLSNWYTELLSLKRQLSNLALLDWKVLSKQKHINVETKSTDTVYN